MPQSTFQLADIMGRLHINSTLFSIGFGYQLIRGMSRKMNFEVLRARMPLKSTAIRLQVSHDSIETF